MRNTTSTVAVPKVAAMAREIRKNGAQSVGQLATMSASEWNAPVAAPHTK